MKKKVLSLMLAFALILSMCLQITVVNAETNLKTLPKAGDVISGFKTMSVGSIEVINSKTVLFEHQKTGAKLLYIQNKDINRSFDITFKTPAVDNTGVNHILEHCSVSGSQKYPLKSGIFSIINQTYSTFANAFTSQNRTTYPVASLSEDQLLKLTDVYLNSVFYPLVYTDKNVFSREAWRYEMADAKAPLTINGTVYNEMKGSLGNIATSAYCNLRQTLLPNSVQSNISGGNPDNIKDLTYDQLIKTHDTYYHPSNSLMVLYGDLDYQKFLKFINDEYLSKFDKKDIKVDKGIVKPNNNSIEKTFKFPVEATSNTKKASQIDYGFALTNISHNDLMGLDIIASLLNQQTSPLNKAFNESKIGGDISVSLDSNAVQPILTFSVQNADESKAKDLKALVDKTINNMVKSGYDKETTDALISTTMLSYSNLTEAGNLGTSISVLLASGWATSDNLDCLNEQIDDIKALQSRKDGYLEDITKKYILNNNHSALITTIPEAGLAEKQKAENEKKLTAIKAKMSKAEIEKIVEATKSYNKWSAEESDPKVIATMQAVKVSNLPEEIKKYPINETKQADGIRLLSAEANVGETGITALFLDTSSVPVEKLHYLQLYSNLLGSLETSTYTQEQLNTKILRYLGGSRFNINTIEQKDNKNFTPYLSVSWLGIMGDYDKQTSLVQDMLENTKFEDSKTIQNVVKEQISNFKNIISQEPIYTQMSRSTAQFDDCDNYNSYTTGIEYYNFLKQIDKELSSNPDNVIKEIKNINSLVVNKTGMIAAFAGNKNGIAKYSNEIKKLINKLPKQSITKQDYTKIPKPAKREGIAVDASVQYNMISASYDKMNTSFDGKYIPIESVINENYTTPKIRFANGAYDNIVNFSKKGLLLSSYRDPKVKETFEIYKGIPDFLENIKMTQDELDRYILKAYSIYSVPAGELSGALSSISRYLSGESEDDRIKILREIKSLTVNDVKKSSELIENFLKNGAYSTSGSMKVLNQNKDLYDSIITVEENSNETKDDTLTRAKFFELLIAGVQNPLDVAIKQGLLTSDAEGNYHENEKITKEQVAVIINKIASLNKVKLTGNTVTIADINSASPWAKESIKAVVNAGIISLDSNKNFSPKSNVKASDIQVVISTLTQKLTKK